MRVTIRGTVVAFQDGQYQQIVVKNADNSLDCWDIYTMMTICPNWQGVLPKLGDEGYFEFEEVQSGQQFFKAVTGEYDQYKHTGCYFLNFIEQKEQIINKDFKFE